MSKSFRKKVRELKIEAHEREIKKYLTELSKKFDDWKKDKISSGELSVNIHEYDKGPSRWMMGFYNDMPLEVNIARAVAIGLLSRNEVPEDLLEMIEDEITYFQRQESRKKNE